MAGKSVIIGIDVGGSTTKIVGMRGGECFSPLSVKADDPLASVYGAFGKFCETAGVDIGDIERIMVTGVGASYLRKDIYGIQTERVSEFLAIGRGGQYVSGLRESIVVSMGTGTAFISTRGDEITHICGSGLGGGTLKGLAGQLFGVRSFSGIMDLATDGDLHKVDLTVADISREKIPNLDPDTTAANFGKMQDGATKNDVALGLVNMIYETIGVMANMACKLHGTDTAVMIGHLALGANAKRVFDILSHLYGINFLVPDRAEYATAIGAALSAGK